MVRLAYSSAAFSLSSVDHKRATAALVSRNQNLATLRSQYPDGGRIYRGKEHALHAPQQQSNPQARFTLRCHAFGEREAVCLSFSRSRRCQVLHRP